ncbi:SDR family NAD(P)-dependent oxidoreductase [Paraburkholderia xenovorans]
MNLELAGKQVVISGASQGIGAAVAGRFAQEGANLVLVARNAQRLGALAARISERYGVDVILQSVDLTAARSAETLARDFPDVDILINNAGVIPGGDLWQVDGRSLRDRIRVVGVNRGPAGCRDERPIVTGWPIGDGRGNRRSHGLPRKRAFEADHRRGSRCGRRIEFREIHCLRPDDIY